MQKGLNFLEKGFKNGGTDKLPLKNWKTDKVKAFYLTCFSKLNKDQWKKILYCVERPPQ